VQLILRASLGALLLLVVVACATSEAPPTPPEQTALPTPAGPTDPAQPTPTDASPTASPATVPTDLPHSPTPADAGFAQIAGFPADGALSVSAAISTAGGFVAVGAEPATGQGVDGVRQGVVWTSADGESWQREADEAFHGASLDHVAELDGSLYAFGFHSLCASFDEECPDTGSAGNAGWRRTAAGEWQRLELPASMRSGAVEGVGVAGGWLVARGSYGDDVVAAIWLSDDGQRWQAITELAGLDYVADAVTPPGGAGMVLLGTAYDFETDTIALMAALSDGGGQFRPAVVPAGISATIEGVAEGPAGLIAVGNLVPADVPGSGAVALSSSDGAEWRSLPADAFAGTSVWAVHGRDDGYLVLGSQVVPGMDGLSAGRAWWSADGRAWTGLTFDGLTFSELTGSAAGDAGAVAFTVELTGDVPVVRAWHAAPEALGR